jgi:hypothetical protein
MITIDLNQGRIGEFWWVNSDQQPVEEFLPLTIGNLDTGMLVKTKLVRWGTCGFGCNIRITMEPIDD